MFSFLLAFSTYCQSDCLPVWLCVCVCVSVRYLLVPVFSPNEFLCILSVIKLKFTILHISSYKVCIYLLLFACGNMFCFSNYSQLNFLNLLKVVNCLLLFYKATTPTIILITLELGAFSKYLAHLSSCTFHQAVCLAVCTQMMA